jgi:hypothetical protein
MRFSKHNAYWVVSGNHHAGSAAFRELPARWCRDFSSGSRFQAITSIANSGYRIRYPLGAVVTGDRLG